jgi:hypothetical protein
MRTRFEAKVEPRRLALVAEVRRLRATLKALYEATHRYLDVTLLHSKTDPLADEAARALNGALADAFAALHPKRPG